MIREWHIVKQARGVTDYGVGDRILSLGGRATHVTMATKPGYHLVPDTLADHGDEHNFSWIVSSAVALT